MKRPKPLTPDERIAQAKEQLAAGSPDYAQAHALIVIAELLQANIADTFAEGAKYGVGEAAAVVGQIISGGPE